MDVKPEFGKVVIFGVGLIGGSFALALKAAEQVEEVVGFGRSLATLTQALDLGIIDRVGANARGGGGLPGPFRREFRRLPPPQNGKPLPR